MFLAPCRRGVSNESFISGLSFDLADNVNFFDCAEVLAEIWRLTFRGVPMGLGGGVFLFLVGFGVVGVRSRELPRARVSLLM